MTARPVVLAFFALSADARITRANGAPVGSESPLVRECRGRLRASADAILLGRGALARFDCWIESAREPNDSRGPGPLYVIVTGSGLIDMRHTIFRRAPGPVHVFSSARMPAARRRAVGQRATLHIDSGDAVDLAGVLAWLHAQAKVRRVLCEGDGRLFRALVEAGLVDELHVVICPEIVGGATAPTLLGRPGEGLAASVPLELVSMVERDGECHARYRFRSAPTDPHIAP